MTSHRRLILAVLAVVLLGSGIVVALARGGSAPDASTKNASVSGTSLPAATPPAAATAASPVEGAPAPEAPDSTGATSPAPGADGSSAQLPADPPVSIPGHPELPAFPQLPPLPPGATAFPCPPGLEQGGTCHLPFPLPPPSP